MSSSEAILPQGAAPIPYETFIKNMEWGPKTYLPQDLPPLKMNQYKPISILDKIWEAIREFISRLTKNVSPEKQDIEAVFIVFVIALLVLALFLMINRLRKQGLGPQFPTSSTKQKIIQTDSPQTELEKLLLAKEYQKALRVRFKIFLLQTHLKPSLTPAEASLALKSITSRMLPVKELYQWMFHQTPEQSDFKNISDQLFKIENQANPRDA